VRFPSVVRRDLHAAVGVEGEGNPSCPGVNLLNRSSTERLHVRPSTKVSLFVGIYVKMLNPIGHPFYVMSEPDIRRHPDLIFGNRISPCFAAGVGEKLSDVGLSGLMGYARA
jgi:hypothetical protein